MQLELGVTAPSRGRERPVLAPRVLALCLPDLPLQRVMRAREGVAGAARRPLAVERGGRVVACDAEARARGVAVGDLLARARAACGTLEVVTASEVEERAALEGLAEALLSLTPAVEVAPPDTLLLDASGARLVAGEVSRQVGGSGGALLPEDEPGVLEGEPGLEGSAAAVLARCEAALVARAVARVGELGWRARAALATGRGPARALARHGPPALPVPPGGNAAALARLHVAALELDSTTIARLEALGLREVGQVAQLPAETLAHRFGPGGLVARRLALGDDPSPLVPHVPSVLPEERLELEAPVEGAEPLLFGLRRLCDHLAARLAGRGLGATLLELTLRLDPRGEERLAVALALPTSAAARWMLVLRERLGALRLPAPVAGAVLSVKEAGPAPLEQLALGDRPEQHDALETVLARLAARLGPGAIFAAEPVERHRPEAAYRPGTFTRGRTRATRPQAVGEGGRARRRAPAEVEPAAPPPSQLDQAHAPARAAAAAAGAGRGRAAHRAAGGGSRPPGAAPLAGRAARRRVVDRALRPRLPPRPRSRGWGSAGSSATARDGRLWLHGFFD